MVTFPLPPTACGTLSCTAMGCLPNVIPSCTAPPHAPLPTVCLENSSSRGMAGDPAGTWGPGLSSSLPHHRTILPFTLHFEQPLLPLDNCRVLSTLRCFCPPSSCPTEEREQLSSWLLAIQVLAQSGSPAVHPWLQGLPRALPPCHWYCPPPSPQTHQSAVVLVSLFMGHLT